MCNICNIEQGKREVLMESDLNLALGTVSVNELATDVYIEHSSTDQFILGFWMFREDGHPIHEMEMILDYCPFCGRKLSRKDKKLFK